MLLTLSRYFPVALRLLRGAIANILVDDTFTIPTEPAKNCLQLVCDVVARLEESRTNDFAEWLYHSLTAIVNGAESKQSKHLNKEKLWRQFHQLRSSGPLANLFAAT